MGLRSWGAVAAGALLIAGCGSTVGGQAAPADPASVSSSTRTPADSSVLSTAVAPTPAVPSPTTPASSTPASTTPASSTPASTTPASSTPASSTPASSTPASTTPPSSTPAPSTTVKWALPLPKAGAGKVNKFGNVIAAPRQSFAIQWRSSKQIAVVFVVDSVQVDRGCEVDVKGQNGHLLVITVRAQLGYSTGKELSDDSIGFTDQFWTAFDAKDTAQVGVDSKAASTCLSYESQMPYTDTMQQGRVYTGKIALDVTSATGTVVLMNSLDGGWIYRYG